MKGGFGREGMIKLVRFEFCVSFSLVVNLQVTLYDLPF